MKINKLIYYGKVASIKVIQQLTKNYGQNVRRQGSGVTKDILWGRTGGKPKFSGKLSNQCDLSKYCILKHFFKYGYNVFAQTFLLVVVYVRM